MDPWSFLFLRFAFLPIAKRRKENGVEEKIK
jgi:hypothetical protein